MKIEPQKRFPVTRTLDPNDNDTNYIRAFIYHLKVDDTEELLTPSGLDLVDQGGQRFLKYWRVKAQQANEGDWVRIETRVYTDSGYSSLNLNYREESVLHLVKKEVISMGGGGGGRVTDYEEIRRIIRQEIKKYKPPKAKITVNPAPVNVKLESVVNLLNKVVTLLANIKQTGKNQKDKIANFSKSFDDEIKNIKELINGLPGETDLKPLEQALSGNSREVSAAMIELKKSAEALVLIRGIHSRLDIISNLFRSAKQNTNFVKINALKREVEAKDKVLAKALEPIFALTDELKFLYDQEDQQS